MIERVAGCLKHGGRGLLRAPKKPFRTRRYLHSAFWSHGASNIDLPAWWRFLLQAHEPHNAISSSKESRSTTEDVAAGFHEIFLNFLYPVQTHALIRRLNRATRSHRQAAQLAQKGSRKYTSVAEDLLAGKTDTTERVQRQEKEAYGDIAAGKRVQVMHGKAEELLERLARPEDYDELWKLQQDAFEASQPLEAEIIKRIFYSLSVSERDVDRERSLALFETIDRKTSMLYRRAVKAALGLKNVNIAVDIHHEAVATNPGSIDIGTPDILKHAIQHGEWKLAIDTWYRLWQSQFVYFSVQRDLWKEVETSSLQDLLDRTEAAADFASSMIASSVSTDGNRPRQDTAAAARDFALAMAERAFEFKGGTLIPSQYLRLLEKIKTLSSSSAKFSSRALGQLLSIEGQEHFAAALSVYSELRHNPYFAPSQGLLEQMLTVLRILESPSGMLMVLEDWQRHLPTKLPVNHYVTIAKVLADNGQADRMESLLRSFHDKYKIGEVPEKVRTRLLNYALRVHHKRADTRKVLQKFDEFKTRHNFIPNIMSYNTVIMTFARVGDVENAMSWFEALKDSGLPLNHHSFYGPIAMFAKRGDIDAVHNLLEELEQNKMKPDMSTINALVVANIKDERYEEAERVVVKALDMDLEGPRTRMWNILLNAHALRADLGKVSALHQQMHRAGVPENSLTYAALLTSLCQSGSVKQAWDIAKNVMPRLGIKRTTFHYVVLMNGYLRVKDYRNVFYCYKHLLKNRFVPDTSIHKALLRAAARSDKKEMEKHIEQTEFARAREVLDMTLQNLDPAELATPMPRKYAASAPIDEAFVSTNYEYMIFLYGTEASFAKVTKLYDEYIAKAKEFGQEDIETSPPMMMLSALLTAHRQAGNDEEVDRCWYLALDKLEKLTQRIKANLAEPGWVLPARRFNISVPLREYMKHLFARQRFDDMINVTRDVRWAGYELYSHQWNVYIQYLSTSSKARHRSLAFKICENELMQNWPGWSRLASSDDGSVVRSWWFMKRAMRRENRRGTTFREKRMVQYKTLVQLAGVYRDARNRGFDVSDHEVSRNELATLAPITVDAVKELPKIPDREQMTYLPDNGY